jgi:2-polyprenyl-3-methyl-5-hydroxy-6-metoxy-1,4-benzoquinol methylase
MSQKS